MPRPRRTASLARRAALNVRSNWSSIEEQVPDDRDNIVEGRSHGAHRRRRRRVCPNPPRHGAREGLQRHRRDARRNSIAACRALSAPTPSRSTFELPDMEGWTVLDRLKHDRVTRHIPVHIISARRRRRRAACASAHSRRCRSRSRKTRWTTRSRRSRASSSGRTSRCWSLKTTKPSGTRSWS